MRNLWLLCVVFVLGGFVAGASANTVASSAMYFRGTLTDEGGGVYTGVLAMVAAAAMAGLRSVWTW